MKRRNSERTLKKTKSKMMAEMITAEENERKQAVAQAVAGKQVRKAAAAVSVVASAATKGHGSHGGTAHNRSRSGSLLGGPSPARTRRRVMSFANANEGKVGRLEGKKVKKVTHLYTL
jgi:hypothetical protein